MLVLQNIVLKVLELTQINTYNKSYIINNFYWIHGSTIYDLKIVFMTVFNLRISSGNENLFFTIAFKNYKNMIRIQVKCSRCI